MSMLGTICEKLTGAEINVIRCGRVEDVLGLTLDVYWHRYE